ncbi:MAG: hypothetical protein RBR79_03850 [Bacteroidales bacterium]|jgi:hypothetical protein|nr:hypothetical protein [Bacteroidales bacterium]
MDSKTYLIKELLSDLSSVGLNSIADRIIQEAIPLEDLLELNFHSDRRISFRSAWVMEKIAYREKIIEGCSHPWLKEELPPIIQKLSLNTTPGQKNYCSKAYKRLMKNH